METLYTRSTAVAIVVFVLLGLTGCAKVKNDRFRLSERAFHRTVPTALNGEHESVKKMIEFFGFYAFNDQCFTQWRQWGLSHGMSSYGLTDEQQVEIDRPVIDEKCKQYPKK